MRLLVCLAALAGAIGGGCATSNDRGPMHDVMLSKLTHAQAALSGVVRADYSAIAQHASALEAISMDAMTMPQDTVSYAVMAVEFREVAGTLAARAAASDLAGVTSAYVDLTRTCVACHERVNRERVLGDFPDKVTRRRDAGASDPLAGVGP